MIAFLILVYAWSLVDTVVRYAAVKVVALPLKPLLGAIRFSLGIPLFAAY